jgi:signal transduction histidine kinase
LVEDDGAGFQPGLGDAVAGHFGLAVMEERARRHGGRLAIESEPGRGTRVEVAIPALKGSY